MNHKHFWEYYLGNVYTFLMCVGLIIVTGVPAVLIIILPTIILLYTDDKLLSLVILIVMIIIDSVYYSWLNWRFDAL